MYVGLVGESHPSPIHDSFAKLDPEIWKQEQREVKLPRVLYFVPVKALCLALRSRSCS